MCRSEISPLFIQGISMASVRANAPPHRALLAALLFNGGARVHGRDKLRHVYFAVGSKSSEGLRPLFRRLFSRNSDRFRREIESRPPCISSCFMAVRASLMAATANLVVCVSF